MFDSMFRRCKLVYTGGGIRSASKRPASLRASLLIEPLETRDLLNAAPTIGGLVFDNPHPQTSDMLQVQVVDVVDLDADPLLFQFDWRVNGQTVRLHSSSTASDVFDLSQPGLGDRGDVIELVVTVNDGQASTSVAASLTVVPSPSELYADYQLAVSQANQVYLDAVGAAVAQRDAALAATWAAAQTAADGYYGQYQATVAQAYQVYLLAQTVAYSAYQSTVAEADITEASAKASAKNVYFTSSSAAGIEDQVTLTNEQLVRTPFSPMPITS